MSQPFFPFLRTSANPSLFAATLWAPCLSFPPSSDSGLCQRRCREAPGRHLKVFPVFRLFEIVYRLRFPPPPETVPFQATHSGPSPFFRFLRRAMTFLVRGFLSLFCSTSRGLFQTFNFRPFTAPLTTSFDLALVPSTGFLLGDHSFPFFHSDSLLASRFP